MNGLQAIVLAGGKGTRLYPLTKTLPKSMVLINGTPFLTYQIELLKKNNITNIVLCVGTFSDKIMDYYGDGSKFGITLKYSIENEDKLLGTAGALKNAQKLLNDEFFVMYGDSYLPIDFCSVYNNFKSHDKLALMTVYKNENKFDKSNVGIQNDHVIIYDKSNQNSSLEYIDYGLLVFKKRALDMIPEDQFVDMDFLIKNLISKRELIVYEVNERFYEIGSITGIKDFENYVKIQ